MGSNPKRCQQRGCEERAAFLVRERSHGEDGDGYIETTARVCQVHAKEASPKKLDAPLPDYRFEIIPLATATETADATEVSEDSQEDEELLQCPVCGWTGPGADAPPTGGSRSCPACQYDIEIVK